MRRQRNARWGLALSMGLAILLGVLGAPGRAQAQDAAKKATEPAAAAPAAPAPAPTPAAPAATPDAAAAPTAPDGSGAGYVAANTTAALTKDGDKVTLETLAKDVKLLKIGDQHLLDADHRLPRHVHAGRLRAGRDRA